MAEIVRNITHLPDAKAEEFGRIFRNDGYQIRTSKPAPGNEPELLLDRQKDKISYQTMLNDPHACFHYLSIQYNASENGSVTIPVGVYGVSKRHRMHFPLFIDDFWQILLTVDKAQFGVLGNITDADSCDLYYAKLIDLRRKLIYNIFKHFFSIDPKYYAAMVFKSRGKQSITRSVAESLGFHRVEDGEHEVYSSIEIDPAKWEYFKGCLERKGTVIGDHSIGRTDLFNDKFNVQLFARSLVNYQLPVGVLQ